MSTPGRASTAARIAALVTAIGLAVACGGCGGRNSAVGWQHVAAPDNDDTHLVVLDGHTAWLFGTGEGHLTGSLADRTEHHTGLEWDGTNWHDSTDPVLGTLTRAVAVSAHLAYGTTCTVPATGHPDTCHLERWTGAHHWRPIAVPQPPGTTLQLGAIAATGADDVWIGGSYQDANQAGSGDLTNHPFAAHWDGHRLTAVPIPLESREMVAASSGNVWATDGMAVTRWDGHAWRQVPIPGDGSDRTGGERDGLIRLGATSTDVVYAVTRDPARRLVRWQGGGWRAVAIPSGVTVPGRAALGTATSGGLWLGAYRGKKKECAVVRDGRWSFSALPPGPHHPGTPSVGEALAAPVEVDGFVAVPGGGVWAYGISAVIEDPPPSDDATRHRIIWRYRPAPDH